MRKPRSAARPARRQLVNKAMLCIVAQRRALIADSLKFIVPHHPSGMPAGSWEEDEN